MDEARSRNARRHRRAHRTRRPDARKNFRREIRDKILVDFRRIGRPGGVSGTRELVAHENSIVPSRVRGKHVDIITVQHAAKRWAAHFD